MRPGFDATVWFGSLDMKFSNTTDGCVYAEVWGRPNGTEVSTKSRRVCEGNTSTSWVTYPEVTNDGEVLFDGVLHKDTYESERTEEYPDQPGVRFLPPTREITAAFAIVSF